MEEMTSYRIFVYGTLMKGEPNHFLIDRDPKNKFIKQAATTRNFNLFDLGGFPGMTMPGNNSVLGEIYEVTARTIRDLDILESHPQFYRRSYIDLADGEKAITYILDSVYTMHCPIIKTGNWKSKN